MAPMDLMLKRLKRLKRLQVVLAEASLGHARERPWSQRILRGVI